MAVTHCFPVVMENSIQSSPMTASGNT